MVRCEVPTQHKKPMEVFKMTDHFVDICDEEFIDIEDDFDIVAAEVHELITALAQGGFFNSGSTVEKKIPDIITTHKQLLEYYRSLEK